MKKFFEGVAWTAYIIAVFFLLCASVVGTAYGFIYVFGEWGVAVFTVVFLCVAGGIINATGDENST